MNYSSVLPREAPIPGQSRAARGSNQPNVKLIRREFAACPSSRALGIAVKCLDCQKDDAAAIRKCSQLLCGLYRLRPFQFNVQPAGAPHVDRLEPTEEPDGLTPGESDDD